MQHEQFDLHDSIEEVPWWFRARRRILLEVLLHFLPPDLRKRTVLEVGCGTGGNLKSLANHYHKRGIDSSAEAVDLARAKVPGAELARG